MRTALLNETAATKGAGLEVSPPPDAGIPGSGGPGGEAPGRPHAAHGGSHRRRRSGLVLAGILLAGSIGAGLALTGSPSGQPGSGTAARTVVIPTVQNALAAPVRSTGAIVTAASPAVVRVVVTEASPASQGPARASGSGVVLTSSGEILTNNHVVAGSTDVRVAIAGHGTYDARVLGASAAADVALLQVEGFGGSLPTARLGNATTVAVGDPVVAIGYAYGLQRATVVTGSVAGLDRTETASDEGVSSSTETLHGLMEVRAAIVSGDSGGPLLNTRGQVVAINTMAGANGTTGFAIPVNTAVRVANQIAAGRSGDGVRIGAGASLGVFGQDVAGTAGVAVGDVAIDGPAERAGITAGDTITAIDGEATTSASALQRAIARHRPGDTVRVRFLDQAGTSRSVALRLGAINP